ncbi:two-component system, chemotaxis family, chemotaxis protein CheY [uncultured Gammaproteobacteria bacterium]
MTKTILCVDDSASMRQTIKLTLAISGYRIVEAIDGLDGLEKAKSHTVDLVITDLNMPRLDGFGLINELRTLPAFKGVPIMFVTTESDPAKRAQAKAVGATAWITKPFAPDHLLKMVRRLLG